MSEWKEYILSDVMDIIGGGTPKTSIPEYWSGTIPWLSVVDFGNENKFVQKTEKQITELGLKNSSTKILSNGQIIISARGTVGELAVIKGNMAFNQSCYGLNAKESICNNNYLYYLLKCKIEELKRNAHGAVFDTITRTTFDTISAIIPDLPTQTAIAEILSSLDDKIELNNKINQELENLAQTLFKQWFIDFEFPNENGEPYKSSGGEMVDSELGEIPKGWEIIQISDVFDFKSGYPFKGDSFSKSGNYGIVTIKNVQDGKFMQDTDNFIDDLPNKFPQNAILNIGDILMSLTGNVGRVCFVTKENCLLNQRVVKFNGKQENSNAFWYYFFRQTSVKDLLISISKGTAQLNLSPVETKSLKFILPKSINENLLAAFDKIFNYEVSCSIESNELIALRDTLLPKLISGELEINELPN